MAVVTGQSTFSPSLMGDNIELMSDGNAVGYGYAVSYDGKSAGRRWRRRPGPHGRRRPGAKF